MSQPQVKVIKFVDKPRDNRDIVPPTDDREFWLTLRQGLLIQLSSIERKLGIGRNCPHCGNDVLRRSQG